MFIKLCKLDNGLYTMYGKKCVACTMRSTFKKLKLQVQVFQISRLPLTSLHNHGANYPGSSV